MQLAIFPKESSYEKRDFLWRLSSAQVELEHSNFTHLPEYNREISVLQGNLKLKVDREDSFELAPLTIYAFDGVAAVESWGKCTDFNLMMKKGECSGFIQSFVIPENGKIAWGIPMISYDICGRNDIALYCVHGDVRADGVNISSGQLLLGCGCQREMLEITSMEGCTVMACTIHVKV